MVISSASRRKRSVGTLLLLFASLLQGLAAPSEAQAAPLPALRASPAARDIINLFSEEMQQAVDKLNWHGERLTDDTIYAVALTGLSWELAWGKDHLFSLAWGDCRKVPTLGKRSSANYTPLIREIDQLYQARDYRQVVSKAASAFTLDEIGCDVNLKEPVSQSLMALGQPERAFPLLARPFEPTHSLLDVSEDNRHFREEAFAAAVRAGLTKEAIAFALSLLLEPGIDAPNVHQKSLQYLEEIGVDIDRVLRGILEAPDRLRDLSNYAYAASDLLAYRATPRLLPVLLHLANSDDVYLRSRALIGLGIVAYQPRPDDPVDWAGKMTLRPVRAYGLSAGERRLIDKEVRDAANSDKYRLRAAAAFALAMTGDEQNVPLLQKLSKDRAYLAYAEDMGHAQKLIFPVRTAAVVGLERYGIHADAGNGEYSGKALTQAKRGAEDKTNDRGALRREVVSQIMVTPFDVATAAPLVAKK